jgi:hypothetical protein
MWMNDCEIDAAAAIHFSGPAASGEVQFASGVVHADHTD